MTGNDVGNVGEGPAAPATGCECSGPGFCSRHGINKTSHLHQLCRTSPAYWDAWESATDQPTGGPTSPPPTPRQSARCSHLGPIARQERCRSCGQREVLANVHWCRVHGECTQQAHGLRGDVGGESRPLLAVCSTCEAFAAISSDPELVVVRDGTCLGDLTVLAAALRELADQHPGRFSVLVESNHSYLFEGAEFARAVGWGEPWPEQWRGARVFTARCDPETWTMRGDHGASINTSNERPRHFVDAYCDHLSAMLALPDRLTCRHWDRPSIRLTLEEKGWLSQVHTPNDQRPFWLVNAGWKSDYPAKRWDGFAEVVSATRQNVRWVQVGATDDHHPRLPGVWRDLRGQTDGRQLVRLVYWTEGVLCGVTGLAHLAHWIERRDDRPRPAVVIAGGREPPHWFQYPQQHTFSTIGQLDCCRWGGCWKSAIVQDEQQRAESSLCLHPSPEGIQGECFRSISPQQVAATILRLSS